MKDKALLISAVVAAVAMVALAPVASAADSKLEKCYGVAKAQQNDCAAGPGTSCAGSSTSDGQKDAWMYLPEGSCEKIVGGSLTAS